MQDQDQEVAVCHACRLSNNSEDWKMDRLCDDSPIFSHFIYIEIAFQGN